MADSIDKKVEQIIERLGQSRDIVAYFQQIAQLTSLSAVDAKALQDALKQVAKSSKDVLGNFEDASKGVKSTVQAQKDLNKSLKTQQNLGVEINKQLKSQGFTQKEIKTILNGTADEREYLLKLAQNALDIDLGAITAAIDANKYQAENVEQGKDNLKIAQNYNTALGITGGLVGGVGEGLKKLGFDFGIVNDALTEAKEKMIDVAEEVTNGGQKAAGFGGKVKVMGAGLKSLGGSIAQGLTDPLFLAEQFVDKIIEVDEGAGKLAKNFGISYDQALGLSAELTSAANSSYLLNVTSAGQAEAFTEINNRYGTFAKISEKTLETHQQLKDTVGLSAEALGAIADSSILTGKETEDITSEFLGQAKALALQNNLALNEKEILESVKDISKATLVSLQGQPQALAKAVVQAKALGTTVEKVADISNSLLQFEDSITSELEAELLIGKDLTLEKARQAALNGDIATVAEEIAKQVGTAAQFGEYNVLQQEALAKAVGMTREDLAASLVEREALTKLAGVEGASAKERFDNLVKEVGMEEAKKRLGDESLANMLASQNVQEKFNAGITKLGDVLTALAIPILQIVSPLVDLVNFILPAINTLMTPISEGFRVMGVMVDYIGSAWNWFVDKLEPIMPVLKGIGIAILAILSPLIAAAGIAAFMAMAGIPVIGPVLAAAAAVGAVSFLTSKMTGIKIQDGMIAPDGGLMVSGKKGTYQLDKNDTVVAGTDLGGGGGRSTGIDIGPLVAEMQNVRAILQQILAKEGSVYIDSTKAGTAFAVGASKLQ
jgi:predicted XRE-type DNA-binding protein